MSTKLKLLGLTICVTLPFFIDKLVRSDYYLNNLSGLLNKIIMPNMVIIIDSTCPIVK